ncbi:hypothetical protein Tco_0670004, partial [Tanacetum coccineum]
VAGMAMLLLTQTLAGQCGITLATMLCCWSANVVIDYDLSGTAWHRVCTHAVLDAALSIPAAARVASLCLQLVRVRFSLIRLCLPVDYSAIEIELDIKCRYMKVHRFPIRRIHQGRYGVSVPALTKDRRGIQLNTQYPEDQYAVLEIWNEYNILEYIKHGPYFKKSPIRRIQYLDTPYRTDFQTL